MFSRSVVAAMLAVCLLLLGSSAAWTQTPPPAQTTLALDLEGPVRPDTMAARQAAIQARLEALAQQADLPQADLDATRATLEQLLAVLTALEETWQQRAAYLTQLEGLPSRLQELARTRQTLEAQPPPDFSKVTEELRSQYEARLQVAQAEVQELRKQTAASDSATATRPSRR